MFDCSGPALMKTRWIHPSCIIPRASFAMPHGYVVRTDGLAEREAAAVEAICFSHCIRNERPILEIGVTLWNPLYRACGEPDNRNNPLGVKEGSEMRENELSNNAELDLDDLDVVAGGAGGADAAELDGQVTDALPNAMFQVQLGNGNSVTCHVSGQLRMKYVRIQPGDRVRVQTNPGDPSRGRIVNLYR